MLKVTVVEPGKKSEPVCAGQVRKSTDGRYGLVVSDGRGKFNIVKLSNNSEHEIVKQFEFMYSSLTSSAVIEGGFPIVVDAELTIKGA